MGPEWDRNEYWDPGPTGTQALSCRWRAPPTPTVGRLHVRHSYPNALRASPRALGASATPLANPVLLLFFNSNSMSWGEHLNNVKDFAQH